MPQAYRLGALAGACVVLVICSSCGRARPSLSHVKGVDDTQAEEQLPERQPAGELPSLRPRSAPDSVDELMARLSELAYGMSDDEVKEALGLRELDGGMACTGRVYYWAEFALQARGGPPGSAAFDDFTVRLCPGGMGVLYPGQRVRATVSLTFEDVRFPGIGMKQGLAFRSADLTMEPWE